MGSKIENILNELEKNDEDFQRAYNYEVFCPRLFFSLNNKSYNLNHFIHDIAIPTINMATEDEHLSHYVTKIEPYSDIQVTFKETSDMAVKNCIEFWQSQMISVNDYLYPPFIARENMLIKTLDMSGAVRTTTLCLDVIPTKLDPPKFGDGSNEIVLQTVTFKVRKAVNKAIEDFLGSGSISELSSTGSNILSLA